MRPEPQAPALRPRASASAWPSPRFGFAFAGAGTALAGFGFAFAVVVGFGVAAVCETTGVALVSGTALGASMRIASMPAAPARTITIARIRTGWLIFSIPGSIGIAAPIV